MTKTDTIRSVARPRGVLSEGVVRSLQVAHDEAVKADEAWRRLVVWTLNNGGSFNEVSKVTGLSKDTLQRWKREASK